MSEATDQSPTQNNEIAHEPRVRWLFASLLVFSAFAIGVAGLGFAGFGPCTASNPAALGVSGVLSAAAIGASVLVLTQRQRKFRLRTIPFYLILLAAFLFAALQVLMLVSS